MAQCIRCDKKVFKASLDSRGLCPECSRRDAQLREAAGMSAITSAFRQDNPVQDNKREQRGTRCPGGAGRILKRIFCIWIMIEIAYVAYVYYDIEIKNKRPKVVASTVTAAEEKRTAAEPKAEEFVQGIKQKDEATDEFELAKIKTSVGEYITFGSYEQDNNINNGKEPIEWLVLEVDKANSKALLISRYALDGQKYNTKLTDVTWETCTLREWLNDKFNKDAFNSKEQKQIADTKVTADKNPKYSTDPGKNTTDKVFLLSITEAEKYLKNDMDRACQGTAYCYAQGTNKGSNGYCWWWLRSPGGSQYLAADVYYDGSVYYYGYTVNYDRGCVRPALWINLES